MLQSTYQERITRFQTELTSIKKQLLANSLIRLLVFLSVVTAVYFLWDVKYGVAIPIGLGVLLFMLLVNRHSNLKYQKEYLDKLILINEQEIEALSGDYSYFNDGAHYQDPLHEFSHDIDLFGPHSFFQTINRTATQNGSDLLAQWITSNNTDALTAKQKAVQELSEKIDFRQEFTATAMLIDQEESAHGALSWLSDYKAIMPKWSSWLPYLFLIAFLVFGTLYWLEFLPVWYAVSVFFIGLIITKKYLKHTQEFSLKISKLEQVFTSYAKIISLLEGQEFKTSILGEVQQEVVVDGVTASSSVQQLARLIGKLDQRNNMLFGFLANGIYLWDIKQVYAIEQWMNQYQQPVIRWVQAIHTMDAYNSLGNFAYNNCSYVFPEITQQPHQFNAQELIHPLLPDDSAVGNDIQISNGQFFIITGANMAGKSTFLRTVSLSIVMANCGLPLRCKQVSYSPMPLITSMRTTDSLSDQSSYFFSELKRLQFITQQLKERDYFIVLDEILKGTNSQDKANGSRKLVERLSLQGATGIIATHDLSLTEIAAEYETVFNYYFDAQIIDDELHFDYKMNEGVATNMNASFLLKKMGIVD